jgi:DNA-directed RNA polymerase
LNTDGLYWVKAAIGSAYNGSRISHDERIQWTENNQNLIKSIAENPLTSINEWERAKEPWQFLQLCLEWNEVVIKGVEKFWKVPVGCDSTASGLQLLSAMRRDPVGMKYANLLPPETESSPPLDAYIRVLEVAKDLIASDPSSQYLMQYLQFRSIGKPTLMVSIYGGSADTIKTKIKNALLEEGVSVDNQIASELQKLLLIASKSVFPAAYEALAWLKRLAAAAHKSGSTSLTWKLPTGDLINLYKYKLNETKKVYLSDGSSIRVADWEDSEPDLTQQQSSFSPSFVHSYDAALCKEAFDDWSSPLVLIHDCIRVLPNDMDRALDRIRDAFTTLVNGDPLSKLSTDLGVDSTQLKPLKQLGCDLDQVLQSRYMFN